MQKLQVGFGREATMPDTIMPLGGVGLAGREYTGIIDELYITCIALTDEAGQTVLLFTHDALKSEAYVTPMRQAISEVTGVPFDHIMWASTHTHAAPAIYYDKIEGVFAYREKTLNAAITAAKTALADRCPADVSCGSFDGTGLAFCRHYVMPDGTVKKTPGTKAGPVAHADPADDQGQLIRFARENRPDILMVGFNVHPCKHGQYKQTKISSDMVGAVRRSLESKEDVLVAYFTGAAGNQTTNSQLPGGENSECELYGEKLGQRILSAALQPVTTSPLAICTQPFTGKSNKARVELIDAANQIADIHHIHGETEEVKALLKQYGIATPWEAYAIRVRHSMPQELTIPLSALRLGDITFVFAPFEMFGAHGMYIKKNTPGAMTFVVSCANESHNYVPTDHAYDYDVYEKQVTRFARGTGEACAEKLVEMAKSL